MANFFPLQPSNQVKITDGTDTLLVNTDGSLNTSGQALSAAVNATLAQNNTQTIYTCPANTVTRIYNLSLSTSTVASSTAAVSLIVNAVTVLKHYGYTAASQFTTHNSDLDLGNNYLTLTAGQTVTITSAGAQTAGYGSILYKEFAA
jgi:hypothetical protein